MEAEEKSYRKIIAVDFDGCLVTNKFPKIGEPIEKNIKRLKEEQEAGATVILWTCRSGKKLRDAIAFCEEHDIHLDKVNENADEIIEAFGSCSGKIFANEYWDDKAVLMDENDIDGLPEKEEPEEDTMTAWAEREIKLACERERADNPDALKEDWDYGCTCYESALKAFRSLLDDGHSGFSIQMTKHILNRLIEQQPLTPIEDTDDVWSDISISDISGLEGEEKNYQCKRRSSLFKYIYADGSVKYVDVDGHYCIDILRHSTYHSGLVQTIMNEMFPVKMPYYPGDPIKVYCQDFLTNRKNGDFDTVAIYYAVKSNGDRVTINRYFKEEGSKWREISKLEFLIRKSKDINKERKTNLMFKRSPEDPDTIYVCLFGLRFIFTEGKYRGWYKP